MSKRIGTLATLIVAMAASAFAFVMPSSAGPWTSSKARNPGASSSPPKPVSEFAMNLPGGKHGLLVASRNLCQEPVTGIVRIKGQNGRQANRQTTLRTPCGKKPGKPKGRGGN